MDIMFTTPSDIYERYLYMELLGEGKSYKTYLAKVRSNDSRIVIKQHEFTDNESLNNCFNHNDFNQTIEFLKTHTIPGVIKIHELLEFYHSSPPSIYIVEEYIQGISLGQMLENGNSFTLKATCNIAIQLLNILHRLKEQTPPILHLDITPFQILLDPKTGNVTLTDFGFTQILKHDTDFDSVMGTYGFMPPEQLMGRPSPASDIYAIGATIINLLTHTPPYDIPTKDFNLLFEPLMEGFPPDLIEILHHMLEPIETKRLTDIDALINAFEQIKSLRIVKPPHVEPPHVEPPHVEPPHEPQTAIDHVLRAKPVASVLDRIASIFRKS